MRKGGKCVGNSLEIAVYAGESSEKYANILRAHGCERVTCAKNVEEARTSLREAEILLAWRFPIHLLASNEAGKIRWIQSLGAGVDDWVADDMTERGITLTRMVGQFGHAMAEHVFAYLLALEKEIESIRQQQMERVWKPRWTGLLGGQTIGIAGLGSIGAEMVRLARAFDMNVYGLSRTGERAHLVDRHFTPDEWTEFARHLDVLVLTLPLTTRTYHVIDTTVLSALPSNAVLVNVGRGKLVNESALTEFLRKGRIRAAILDVFETEPLPMDSTLWTLSNVYVTPHMSGPTRIENAARFFLGNLQRYLEGLPLQGVVEPKRGY